MTTPIAPRIPLALDFAIEQFKEAWDYNTLGDIATKLTCFEFEGLIDLALALDIIDAKTASEIEAMHAEEDECGDTHCRCDDEDCIKEREGVTANDDKKDV